MPTEFDSRSDLERNIDSYVREIMVEQGDKNPVRRKALVDDVNFALQAIEPFKERYANALEHDLFVLHEEYDKALEILDNAVETFKKLGIDVDVPSSIENPHLIEAECVMALCDTLKSLNAFEPVATEKFVTQVMILFFGRKQTSNGLTHGIGRFLNLYVNDGISDYVLDKMTMEESYLEAYLKSIQKEYRTGTDG